MTDDAARTDILRALLAAAATLGGGLVLGLAGTAAWYRWNRPDPEATATTWGREGPR